MIFAIFLKIALPIVAIPFKNNQKFSKMTNHNFKNFSEFSLDMNPHRIPSKKSLRHCFVSFIDVRYSDVCTWFFMSADVHDSSPKTLILVCSANKHGIIWNSKISSKFSSVLFFKFNRKSRIHDYHMLLSFLELNCRRRNCRISS